VQRSELGLTYPNNWLTIWPNMAEKELRGIWVLEALRRGGVETDRLAREHPIELDNLLTDPRTISPTDLNVILNCCVRLSGDQSLGLHMIDYVDVIMMGPMGYLQLNAPTVRDLLDVTVNFFHILYRDAAFIFSTDGRIGTVEFRYERPPDICFRQHNEWSLGFLPCFITNQLGYRWQPLRAEFTNDAPESITDLAAVFGDDLSFNAERTAFEFDVSLLDITINRTDPHLLRILTKQAETLMHDVNQARPFAAAVRMHVLEGLEKGSAGSGDVAHRMAMSRSTLKRRLADCDLTFRRLRDEVIYQVATKALLDTTVDVGTVAAKLGYSELSAFDRAFRRLAGVSPTKFRNGRVGAGKIDFIS